MDISQSVWAEADASNNTPAPDGAPEGMFPSGVNDVIRADRGAIKRWYNQTIPLLTGGSSTAFTLSYGVAPTAIADGMTHLVRFHTTNGAAATLNVNALGAKPLYAYVAGTWMAAPAGAFPTDMIARVACDSASGTYRILGMCNCLGVQSFSGVSTVTFPGIPPTANHLEVRYKIVPSANGTGIFVQTGTGAGPTWATGTTDYYYSSFAWNTVNGSSVSAITTAGIHLASANNVGNDSTGLGGRFDMEDIQGATFKTLNGQSNYFDSGGVIGLGALNFGRRNDTTALTAIRFGCTGGTMAGKITVNVYV